MEQLRVTDAYRIFAVLTQSQTALSQAQSWAFTKAGHMDLLTVTLDEK